MGRGVKLYAGPFCGEFGWEIMTWQAHLRAIAPDYDEVIVCCPPNHTALYADFASTFVEYDPTTVKANMWMNEVHDDHALRFFKAMIKGENEFSFNGDGRWMTPAEVWRPFLNKPKWEQLIAIKPQKFIEFGEKVAHSYCDIIIHARNRDDWDSGFRNWGHDHCKEFVDAMPDASIACIGTKDYALHIERTVDLRDKPLWELFNIMRNSKVFIGPISGPTHLATLCGLPQVTWATKEEHKDRIEKKWNPFDTPTSVFVSDDRVWRERINWHPPVEEIVEGAEKYL